jgi:periplasmic protein TonB
MRLPVWFALLAAACAGPSHDASAPGGGTAVAAPGTGTGTPKIASDVDCRFPDEAEALGIDEADVIVRVVVAPTGAAEGADVVRDPGHGFREAALECVLAARYVPAHNPAGRPMRAVTAPFRVHFSRSGAR